MKRVLISLTAVAAILFAGSSMALAADPQAGQCTGYNDPANIKVDTTNDDLVLAAGLTVCIHASNHNTGSFVTDGVTTLGGYIIKSGILNEGGQVPGVSNYVVYGVPSSTPTPTPTPTPVVTPTPTPVVTPTPTPVVTPTPPVGISQFAVTPAPCRTADEDSRLGFRVIAGLLLINQVDIFIDGVEITAANIEIVDGTAYVVVAPGLRAWEIRDQVTGAVLASGETICPTCRDVLEGTPTPAAPGTTTPTVTAPPTDIEGSATGSTTPVLPLLLVLGAIGGAAVLLTPKRR